MNNTMIDNNSYLSSPPSSLNSPSALTNLSLSSHPNTPNQPLPHLPDQMSPHQSFHHVQHQHMYRQDAHGQYDHTYHAHTEELSPVLEGGDLESEVAELIREARKSWKNVKGRTERVWPQDLEVALVKGLLAYKPTDSRYARALGRFPKRNRFISDYIFKETGHRRTPKQVGSRLQQLKDVQCGKQLLNRVASRSLGLPPDVMVGSGSVSNNCNGSQSNGLLGGGSFFMQPTTSSSTSMGSYGVPDNRYLGGLSTPSSVGSSSQLSARHLETFVKITPEFGTHPPIGGPSHGFSTRCGYLMRFGGNLSHPDTVFACSAQGPPCRSDKRQQFVKLEQQEAPTLRSFEPVVTFTSSDPIGVDSCTTLYYDGPDGLTKLYTPCKDSLKVITSSPTLMQGLPYSAAHSTGLAVQRGYRVSNVVSADDSFTNDAYDGDRSAFKFVYSTKIASDETWRYLCESRDPTRFYFEQELILTLDLPSGHRKGDVFLKVRYQFTTSSVPPSPQTQGLPELSNRVGNGSASPISTSGSGSPGVMFCGLSGGSVNPPPPGNLDFNQLLSGSSTMTTATQLAMASPGMINGDFSHTQMCGNSRTHMGAYPSPMNYGLSIDQSASPYLHPSLHIHPQHPQTQTIW